MKRSWIGLAMLAILLASALGVSWAMREIHTPITRRLEQAADDALAGRWDKARDQAQRAEAAWEDWSNLRGCFADHGPIEEVEAAFAELEAYGEAHQAGEFAAACRGLARKVTAMGDAHGLSLRNLL